MFQRAYINLVVLSDAKPCRCTEVPSFWRKALPLVFSMNDSKLHVVASQKTVTKILPPWEPQIPCLRSWRTISPIHICSYLYKPQQQSNFLWFLEKLSHSHVQHQIRSEYFYIPEISLQPTPSFLSPICSRLHTYIFKTAIVLKVQVNSRIRIIFPKTRICASECWLHKTKGQTGI
jgi:hypothetical protein